CLIASTLARCDYDSPRQVETITWFQEVVRLAIVPLAICDGDATVRSADNDKLLPVHHGSYACLHADPQQAWIRGHYLADIAFPMGAWADVAVDGRVGKKADPHPILFREIILKVFVLNSATDKERAQNHGSCGGTADDATLFIEPLEFAM